MPIDQLIKTLKNLKKIHRDKLNIWMGLSHNNHWFVSPRAVMDVYCDGKDLILKVDTKNKN